MQGGNAPVIKKQVQQQFHRNVSETDPVKVFARRWQLTVQHLIAKVTSVILLQIAEQKDAAIRGLSNYMFMEAQRMAKVFYSIA